MQPPPIERLSPVRVTRVRPPRLRTRDGRYAGPYVRPGPSPTSRIPRLCARLLPLLACGLLSGAAAGAPVEAIEAATVDTTAGPLPDPAAGLQDSRLHALDTMAPQGRWAARLEMRTNGYDLWFDDRGRMRGLGGEFDRVDLNAGIFPALALLGPGATLGTTRLRSRVNIDFTALTMGYGITENLTVGFILPYSHIHTGVGFAMSGGNVGFNPAFNAGLPIGPGNFPFAPVGGPVTPMGSAGVQRLLTDPAFGYRYKPVGSVATSGIGDPTFGFLWRLYKGTHDSAVLGLGVHAGWARDDDPDDLFDVQASDGSTDLEARLEYFRALGAGWDLRLFARHREQTADRVTRRIPRPGEILAPFSTRERVERDLGDYREYDIELGHSIGAWRGSLTWHLYEKSGDHYRSSRGTDVSALEANTHIRADQWRAGLSWSGVGAFLRGALPLPIVVKLEMQDTYGGRNFPKVRDVYVQVTSFF